MLLCGSLLVGLAVFLSCSEAAPLAHPVSGPGDGAISKRSVAEQQFMNDKGRMLKEMGRRLWMHSMVSEVHTAPRGRDGGMPPRASLSGARAGSRVALHRSLRHVDPAAAAAAAASHGLHQPGSTLAHHLEEGPVDDGTIP
ncbi:unnamed protein product [Lampetra fluviatilis]